MPPRLSFIVPVRNDAARLERCLASIHAHDAPTFEVIVADNGSTDGSATVARQHGARVIERPDVRVSTLRNEAASLAEGDYLAFVDADHELGDGWARTAVGLLDGDDSIGAAGAPYRAPSNGTWVQRMYDRLRQHRPGMRETDWLPSGNLVVRRSTFTRLAGFDTALETCEDVEFCQRLRATGARIVADDRLLSIHQGDPRTLRALFVGELWRGRDNLRVSLRVAPTLRSLPGIALPLLNLLALGLIIAGLLTWPLHGGVAVGLGLAMLTITTVMRAGVLLSSADRQPGPTEAIQAWLVAAVYDLARALALVSRTAHDARRQA